MIDRQNTRSKQGIHAEFESTTDIIEIALAEEMAQFAGERDQFTGERDQFTGERGQSQRNDHMVPEAYNPFGCRARY